MLVQSGGEGYLLDAGKAQAGPKSVDFLRSRGVDSLNGIVVSNPDAEHIGGFEDVLNAFEVANVYLSPGNQKEPQPTTRSCAPCGTRDRRWSSLTRGCRWIGGRQGRCVSPAILSPLR